MDLSFFNRRKLILSAFNEEEPNKNNDYSHVIDFNMVVGFRIVGYCDLRIGMNDMLYYAGNIGYHVYERYRDNGYAYKACLELFKIAKNVYHMDKLIITCSPDNIASKKTLIKLGGQLLETCDVPSDHWLYLRGETVKEIYLFKL